MEKFIQITTTSDDRSELEKIAAHLIEQNLAACCQIEGPISSWYRWNGEIVSNQEWVCSIKTLEHFYLPVEEAILAMHHYEVPQVISTDIAQTSLEYEKWLRAATRK